MTIRYPWPTFASPLQSALSDIRLDGEPLQNPLVDDDHLRLRLDRAGDWQRFDCDIAVTTDETVPDGIDDLRGFAMVSSISTNTRLPFALTSTGGLPAAGHLTIPRSTVAGSFTVQAEIGAHIRGRHRVVGSSEPWTVVLERREAPIPPGAPPFDISWVDFNSPEAPPAAKANPASHALMDLSGEPRLLLNSGIDGLQALLYNKTAQKERRRMREILSSSIARYATTTLFRTAAAQVVAYDDGPPQPPSAAVLQQTCKAVADHMSGIGGVDELYELISTAADDPLAAAELWLRVDPAVDAATGTSTALSDAAKEVVNG